ncbi:MAG: SDR family NAD(P)-dependent oxidoreductase [Anaerolineales bacterium]
MKYFTEKIAIVTGGASGIGRALCEALAENGAKVVVADINRDGAEKTAAAIMEANGQAQARKVDVTKMKDVQKVVDETAAEHGRLDFLFNNAGVTLCGEVRDLTLDHWQRMIDVNLWGVIHGVQAAYPLMVKQGSGHIVNVASLDGLTPMPMAAPYTAAKHAIVGLSTVLRLEAEELGVKVSVACPGAVKTGVLDAAEFIGVQREGAIGEIAAFNLMDADVCARAILRGVARNEQIILDGAVHNRIFWWMYRVSPSLYSKLMQVGVGEIRKHRLSA